MNEPTQKPSEEVEQKRNEYPYVCQECGAAYNRYKGYMEHTCPKGKHDIKRMFISRPCDISCTFCLK